MSRVGMKVGFEQNITNTLIKLSIKERHFLTVD